jgi:hypothetical protein
MLLCLRVIYEKRKALCACMSVCALRPRLFSFGVMKKPQPVSQMKGVDWHAARKLIAFAAHDSRARISKSKFNSYLLPVKFALAGWIFALFKRGIVPKPVITV